MYMCICVHGVYISIAIIDVDLWIAIDIYLSIYNIYYTLYIYILDIYLYYILYIIYFIIYNI